MDLDRIRKLAGLPTESVQAPSQIRENVVAEDKEALSESTNVDFSTKPSEMLVMLEAAIDEAGEMSVTLSEDKQEALDDIEALGLTEIGSVVDLGNTVFRIYEDADSALWFYQTAEAGTIHKTSMVMETLQSFHVGADIDMRDSDATEDEDALIEGKGKEKCKKCGQVPCKCKKDKKGGKPDADGDGVPDWADKKNDKCADADGDKKKRTTIKEDDNDED